MATKIRLKRIGRRNRPFYRMVAMDSRNRRDGAAIEELGWYNPIDSNHSYDLKDERILHWLGCLLYTSPSPRDATLSRMPSSA